MDRGSARARPPSSSTFAARSEIDDHLLIGPAAAAQPEPAGWAGLTRASNPIMGAMRASSRLSEAASSRLSVGGAYNALLATSCCTPEAN